LLIPLIFGGKLIGKVCARGTSGNRFAKEGPKEHQVKRGTPTMGGVLIVGSVVISTLLWARLSSLYVWTVLIATLAFAAIGFMDDYAKMRAAAQSRFDGKQKTGSAISDSGRCLAGSFHLHEIFWRTIFVERRYSVLEG